MFLALGGDSMMKLSRLADYGVLLISQMAASQDEVHSAQALSEATQLPLPTVSKVLSALARADLLVAHRGARGGFRLARSPRHISVADIIGAVDGPVALTQCLEHGPGACEVAVVCPTRRGWQTINRAVQQALEAVSLAELVAPAPELWSFQDDPPRDAVRHRQAG
ncbi:MAG: SUF system Fe-S cluster assembly regulator [Rhodospirillales bacterium]|nr:MAG: SUF system Fe-S cluster assembly regulator [Rhodospirillales bacterium]